MTPALHLLRREWRSGELSLLFQALVVAVATVTATALFTDRLQRALVAESTAFLAADRVVEGTKPIPEAWWDEAAGVGLQRSRMVRFLSMVFSGERAQFASVKAVDDAYPLRGNLEVSTEPFTGAVTVAHGPAPGEAWLESRIVPALDTAVGEEIEIGEAAFRVTRVIVREPDRGRGFENAGPRVMMHLDDVEPTKVIQPGSRVTYRYLFAGDPADLEKFDDFMRARVEDSGMRYFDVRDGLRNVGNALRRIERFLLLGSLLAVLLAGVAVALTARRYAARHLDHVAIMKTFGATPRRVTRLFTLLTAAVFAPAAVAGLLVGLGVQALITLLLNPWIPVELPAPGLRPFATGVLTGGLCLAAFALPPVLQLRRVSPMRVIRRDFSGIRFSVAIQYAAGGAGLVTLLLWYSRDPRLTVVILAGALVTLAGFGGLTAVLLKSGRALGMHAGNAWRLALSSIQRRSRENTLQVLAFGLVIMLLLTLTLVRSVLIDEWRAQLPDGAPNHFVINVAPGEVEPIKATLLGGAVAVQPFYPMVRGRIVKVNGRDAEEHEKAEGDPEQPAPSIDSERNLTWSTTTPGGNLVIAGEWWPENHAGETLVSLEKDWAARNGLNLGDRLDFLIQGQNVTARVASIRTVDWDTLQPNFYVVFSPGGLDAFGHTYMTSFFLPPGMKTFLNEFLRTWPTVTVIEVDAVIEQVQSIIDRGTLAIELVLGLVLIAGALVFLAGVRASMDERVNQHAIIRALGASRRLVMGSLIIEFCALGLLAGLLAAAGAELSVWMLQTQVLDVKHVLHPWLWLAGPLIGATGVGVIGVLTTRRLVRVPPMLTLRESV